MKFSEMSLSRQVLQAVTEMGFETATPIQEQAIPFLMQGEDIIGQARTGTGKTAAFGIPIIERIIANPPAQKPFALVLAPTRELALQVCDQLRQLGAHAKIHAVPIYGGASIEPQITHLSRGADIVVGTPGRILDHIDRGTLKLASVHMVVLDEADRMLDMGFIDDVNSILAECPKERQTMLFSATMPDEIKRICSNYMVTPQHIKVSEDEFDASKIEQFYVEVSKQSRLPALIGLLQKEKPTLALIFTRTKMGADRLNEILNDRGFKSMCLHGDMSQGKRDRTMEAFRSGQLNVLVATDLAARGIDVMDISHVFNYDIGDDPLTYVHRVGRTGRMKKTGRAISLIFSDQYNLISMCEKAAQHKILKMEFEIPPLPPRPHGAGGLREGGSSRFGHGGGRFGGERRSFGGGRFGSERRSYGSREGGSYGGSREGGHNAGYQGNRPREGGAPHSGSREGGHGGSYGGREGGRSHGGSYGRREGGYGGSHNREGGRGGSSYGRREGGHGGSREGGRFGGDREKRSRERSTRGGSSYFGRRG